jgi:endonuclease/exonuclease/phosphatase family metal-dependent hydrolase
MLVTRTMDRLPVLPVETRRAMLDLPVEPDEHRRQVEAYPAFHAVEFRPAPRPRTAPGPARIVAWNAERLKYLDSSIELLEPLEADALLLTELDIGMARSGNRRTVEELAERLHAGYAFGLEYLELDLGDAREREWHAGEINTSGLHGAAIVSRHRLSRPAVIRLELDGAWFDGQRGERRIGGRIGVAATLTVAGVLVTLVSVHFESHSDPAHRAEQMRRLLDAVDAYAPPDRQPVLIGGDFNTSTVGRNWSRGTGDKPKIDDPQRLLDPVPYEPLFEVAAARGYDWRECNERGVPTQRTRPDGTPTPPLGRIDWLFARGLRCSSPATVPAVDPSGTALSDHEVLAITIEPVTSLR